MQKKHIVFLLFIIITGSDLLSQDFDTWKKIKTKDSIDLFEREEENSKIKAYRAETIISANPEKLLGIIMNFDNYINWMKGCKESYSLNTPSDSIQYAYVVYDVPWPLPDRDCINQMQVHKLSQQEIQINFTSAPKYIPKKKGKRRIVKSDGVWKLKQVSNELTQVNYESAMELGIDIPPYIQNKALESTTIELLEGLIENASL